MDEARADEADADHAEPAREVDAATYAETLRSIIEGVREEPATAGAGDPLDMLESRYEEMNKPATTAFAPPPPPAPPAEDAFDFSTLEALTASYAPPPPAEVSATPTFAPEFLDEAESIEMPDFVDEGPSGAADFSADAGEAQRPLAPASAFDDASEATDDELAASIDDVFDLDALEKLFGDAPVDLAREPASVDVGDLGDLGDPPDSTEAPLIEKHASGHAEPVETAASGFSFVDAVDVVPAPTQAPNEPTTMTSTLKLAAAADWSLEDMLEGDMPSAPIPVGPADFGIEKLSAAEYLAPSTENTAPPPVPDSDFSFELMPMEEAVAPQAIEREVVETWLDPDKVVLPPKIRRVWVLGASIGGPEAVRDFLGELPRDYPALFLLAQHMGVEFVDLMAQQLAKSTQLTVRTPTHGERVGHGEVVIVPTTHRLQVDPEGVVVLERIGSDGAYSPSIDRVLRDVADRYGANAGAIVFSGMTTDAVEGSKYLTGKGGTVYAQHPDTCVVSSMIDGVVELGVVKFLGSPKELAEQLLAETAKSKR
jgi:two-component system chemotaxis response regulator CheB/chemosensory pili system protein ChpB (putative protein-glutamate methylesterase)